MLNAAQDYNSRAEALEKKRFETRQNQPSPVSNEGASFDRNRSHLNNAVDEARKAKGSKKTFNPLSVLAQANLLQDMPFVCAFGAAFLKEIFDIVFAPTIVLPITFSILNTIFGFMMMQLAKFSEKVKIHNRFIMKIVLLIGGGVFDAFSGLNFLPLSITSLLAVYGITLWERANAETNVKRK